MKLKIKHKLPAATELAKIVPSPKNGVIAPIDKRFKAGAEWNGNKGGRPKKLTAAVEEELDRIVRHTVIGEDGIKHQIKMPRRKVAAMNLVDNSCSAEPHSVSAFRAIREMVEPADAEPTDRDNFSVAREVLILMMERAKHMEIKDII